MGIFFIILICVPYIWAFQNVGSDHKFGGFLLNPIDGNSYLAKMYQGWQGNWKFNLPYSAQTEGGGYLFLFYLALGHLSRITGISLQTTFHGVRILGAVLLLLSLWHFFSRVLSTRRARYFALGLALFGSGMGWIAAMFGLFTADFWVAEGYPFLSAYANPHFPIGMAIMLWILTPKVIGEPLKPNKNGLLRNVLLFVAAFVLSMILPFGVVVAMIVLVGLALWEFWSEYSGFNREFLGISVITGIFRQSGSVRKLFPVLLGGIPVLVYEAWITQNDPFLAIWNEQNLTISPSLWDTFISFSPLALFAIPGIYWVLRKKMVSARVLLVWVGLGILLMYVPWNLQRRFFMGYLIPLAGLAAIGLDYLFMRSKVIALAVTCLIALLILPTNLIILIGGIQAVRAKEPKVVLTRDEFDGLMWLESNLPRDALVLASPEMGLFIPAYTGRRVLYGHPYETVNATQMEELVLKLFRDLDNGNYENLHKEEVSYLFYGSREQEIAGETFDLNFEPVYSSGEVQIYKIQDIN